MCFFFFFFAIDRNLSTVKLNVAIIKEYQDKKNKFSISLDIDIVL